ncbi:MAG: tetratricopeptide repeat protein [Planctomycetota bacterium]|jgi:tetratricopeptide (TPR) repeat protein
MQEQGQETPEAKKRRELEEQYRELRNIIEDSPSGFNHARLGDICFELGRIQEAIGSYNRALSADPDGAQYLARKIQQKLNPHDFKQIIVPAPIIPISQALPDIVMYPFRGKGLGLVIIGAVFFAIFTFVLQLIQRGFLWFFGIGIWVILFGYLLSYYISILKRTAFSGEDEPPNWPDFMNIITEIAKPAFWFFATIIMGFFPAIVLLIIGIRMSLDPVTIVLLVLLGSVLGIVAWPMLLMAVFVFNQLGAAFDPRFIFRSIAQMGATYALGAVIFYALMICITFIWLAESWIFSAPFGLIAGIPVSPLLWFVRLFLFMAAFRLLGLMYREKARKLSWFEE